LLKKEQTLRNYFPRRTPIFSFPVTLVTALALLALLPLTAYAATTTTISDQASCQTVGGAWDDTTYSGVQICNLGSYTVAAGDTLVVAGTVTAVFNGTLTNNGTLINNYWIDTTTLINNSGATINTNGSFRVYNPSTNSGTININNGGFTSYNLLTNTATGLINVNYELYLDSGGSINNQGSIVACAGTIYGVENITGKPAQTECIAPTASPSAKNADVSTYTPGSWTNQDVTVSWNWSDNQGGSGIDPTNCTTTSTSSGEGAAITLTASCKDKAANLGSASYTVQVDKTAPTVAVSLIKADGTPYTPGSWTNQTLKLVITCSDALSGLSQQSVNTCQFTHSISGEGNYPFAATASVTDNAGNQGSGSLSGQIQLDKTKPTITVSAKTADGQPYTAGTWTNQDVTVSFSCSDALSGLSGSCPADKLYRSEGSFTAQGSVSDNAGNSNSANFGPILIDRTKPVANPNPAPAANAKGWNNSDVTITWNWSDNGSGIDPANCTTSSTSSGEGVAITLTASCTDKVGNTSTATYTVKVDKTAPAVTATPDRAPDSNGWYNAPVTFSFSGNDGSGSGGVTCNAPKTYSGPDSATASITGKCTDAAGNVGSATPSFKYDATKPTISISVPSATSYLLNQVVTVSFSCDDILSKIDTCTGTVANGGKLDTASAGSKSFIVNAKDKAGNTYSQTVNYSVGYKVCLSYDPQKQATSPGSTMPVKLQLCDASGKSVSSSSLTLTAINVDGKANLLNDSGSANPGNRFVYSSGYYQFNLKVPTSGLISGKQHYLTFTVSGDTTNTYTVTFYTK
jgi:hypothetical protein